MAVTLAATVNAATSDWPCWRGPFANGTAPDCAQELLDDPAQAKLVWKSEDFIPGSCSFKGTSGWLKGGFASPVVAEGRVYLAYFVPGGRSDYNMTPEDRKSSYNGDANPSAVISADDVVHCFDAATGKTLWKATFKDKGLAYDAGKDGGHFTPCVANGKVYAIGSTGRVYCVDATTGKTVWESDVGGASHQRFEEMRKTGQRGKTKWCSFCGCPSVAAGVVANNDNASGLVGHDAETGQRLWQVPGACKWATFALRWVCQGQEYFISYGGVGKGEAKTYCIEPRTGKVRWTFEAPFDTIKGVPAISDDYLVGGTTTGPMCLRITPEGAKLLWHLAAEQVPSNAWVSTVAHGGHAYFFTKDKQLCVNLVSGKTVGTAAVPGPMVASPLLSNGKIIAGCIGGGMNVAMTRAEAKDFRKLGGELQASMANSTSLAVADGRIYFRGNQNLCCYDLRKAAAQK